VSWRRKTAPPPRFWQHHTPPGRRAPGHLNTRSRRGAALKKISKLKAIDERRSSFASPCTRHLRVAMRAFTMHRHSLRASISQGGVEEKTVGVRTRPTCSEGCVSVEETTRAAPCASGEMSDGMSVIRCCEGCSKLENAPIRRNACTKRCPLSGLHASTTQQHGSTAWLAAGPRSESERGFHRRHLDPCLCITSELVLDSECHAIEAYHVQSIKTTCARSCRRPRTQPATREPHTRTACTSVWTSMNE
jgi:hypothetical protein